MGNVTQKLGALHNWQTTVGWGATLAFGSYRTKVALGFPEPAVLRIKPRVLAHPVSARLHGSSDLDVFRQIFVADEYSCVRDIQAPRLIFDLGANVGYSSAYFLSRFPTTDVIAVEPDPANYEMCRVNLEPYGQRVQIVLGAAWSTRSKLVLRRGAFGDGREWASQVHETHGDADEAAVDAWDIPSLLQLAGQERIDLLKVDIEAGEINLFGANTASWLPRVRNICIELHGRECEDVFFGALKDYSYELSRCKELTVCRNLQQK